MISFKKKLIRSLTGLPTVGLGGEYLFEGNAEDTSGNNNHGTVFGATLTAGRKGGVNSAYDFISAASIDIGYDSTLFGAQFSYSCWVYMHALNTSCIFDSWVTTAGLPSDRIDALAIVAIGGTTSFELIYNKGTSTAAYRSSQGLSTGQWYYVTAVHGLLNDKIYINGDLDASASYRSGSFGAGVAALTPNMRFGKSLNGAIPFVGKIDDSRKYTKELTQKEVTTLYNE